MKYVGKYTDKKKFKQSFVFATFLHIMLGVIFSFVTAWEVQDPPVANPGIEIAFGIQNLGKSEVTPKEVLPLPPTSERKSVEEHETTAESLIEEKVVETAKAEEAKPIQENILSQKEKSIPIPSPKKLNEQITPTQKKVPTQKVNKSLFFKKKKKNRQNSKNKSENEYLNKKKGLKSDKVASTNGASLNLSGWQWEAPPLVDDESAEQGKIVFKITIDEFGKLLQVVTVERTVTPLVEQKYINAVKKLSFHSIGIKKKGYSTGHITFILESK